MTFDLGPDHYAWVTTKMEGLFAFNLAQCGSATLPDGSMLVTAQVQWGQGSTSHATKTAPVSLVVFRAVAPFLEWKLHGVVANASQFPTGFHGYGEGANENSILRIGETLLVVFRDDDQLGQFDTSSCNYTSVRSTDLGRTWSRGTILPAGTVCPALLPLGGSFLLR